MKKLSPTTRYVHKDTHGFRIPKIEMKTFRTRKMLTYIHSAIHAYTIII